jgi:predicted aconitase with swiveling domain
VVSSEPLAVLRGHPGVGPDIEGQVWVCEDNFSARYDLDRRNGTFSRRSHRCYGQSLVDKVCVFNTAKGGVSTSWALLDMKTRGVAPAALIFRLANPVMVQGAVLADLPLMDRLEPDPITSLRSGDWVRVRPSAGVIEVLRRAE